MVHPGLHALRRAALRRPDRPRRTPHPCHHRAAEMGPDERHRRRARGRRRRLGAQEPLGRTLRQHPRRASRAPPRGRCGRGPRGGGGPRGRGPSAAGAPQLGPGQGAVLDLDGEPAAVYADPAGALHALSAACTHLGCTVEFNPDQATWDCPCHGSRFSLEGSPIRGPATTPLRQRTLPEARPAPRRAEIRGRPRAACSGEASRGVVAVRTQTGPETRQLPRAARVPSGGIFASACVPLPAPGTVSPWPFPSSRLPNAQRCRFRRYRGHSAASQAFQR
ncbi:Rieske 2Fe-2S domain-containing protein [Sinomonas atrocyanea]|uniref:Rieske 2Fe-2S domain-containing protein n=1 Tax=Sinomonas atrocyanea TaxID=37927 RepID=UPI0027B8FB5A|nr:Rieske 2Fe-2S domain-containing protein [Sinomonas atrocyanea]